MHHNYYYAEIKICNKLSCPFWLLLYIAEHLVLRRQYGASGLYLPAGNGTVSVILN
jgi:hypothetical protein